MKMNAPKNVNRKPFDYTRRKKSRADTASEIVDRQRMIQDFIREKGVKRLPAGFSHVDW